MAAPDGHVTVVGIGADGWAGLGEAARDARPRRRARSIGSERQLALLPADEPPGCGRGPRRSRPLVDELAARDGEAGRRRACSPAATRCCTGSARRSRAGCRAASARGDTRTRPPSRSRARAWAGRRRRSSWSAPWPTGRGGVARSLQPGRRLVVYVAGADGAAEVARARVPRRLRRQPRWSCSSSSAAPPSGMTESTAAAWASARLDPLHAVAIECVAEPDAPLLPLVPGLPDDAYDHDGQLTKRHVRAATLAALAPAAGRAAVGRRRRQRLDRDRVAARRADARARSRSSARAERAERVARNALRAGRAARCRSSAAPRPRRCRELARPRRGLHRRRAQQPGR